ncbi:MAG: winged helix-turn-helix domain-containing protein [Pseudomonadota bacterium]
MHLLFIQRSDATRAPFGSRRLATGLRLDITRRPYLDDNPTQDVRYDLALVDTSRLDPFAQARLDERQAHGHVPVIALLPEEALDCTGKDRGGKRVAMPKLMGRIKGILECHAGPAVRTYQLGALRVRPDLGQASFAGTHVTLSPRELSALTLLVRHAPHAVPRPTLERAVYGADAVISPNAIEAVLSRLRRSRTQIGCPARIVARRGIGWQLTTPDTTGGQSQ